jgi:hypothetical protein
MADWTVRVSISDCNNGETIEVPPSTMSDAVLMHLASHSVMLYHGRRLCGGVPHVDVGTRTLTYYLEALP